MAGKTFRMAVWNCLEGALLQPERLAQVFRRLGKVLFARLPLRLISLMTDWTVRRRLFLLLTLPRRRYERRLGKVPVATNDVEMSLVRKIYGELADCISSRPGRISHVSQARKQEPYSIARRYCDVAIRADLGRRPFAREELLPVAIKTCRMLGKLGDILESVVALSHLLPVGTGKFVAPSTRQLLFRDVSSMRKRGVISCWVSRSVSRGLLLGPRRGSTAAGLRACL